MLISSKEANKLLKKLVVKRESLLNQETNEKLFCAAVGEEVESCRPEYNYEKTQAEIDNVESEIIKIKHCINKFNSETEVDGFNKTIDEMLIYIPFLTQRQAKLSIMANAMPKTRVSSNMRSTIIDYRYTNYDIKKAKADYEQVSEELSKAQIALDNTNITTKFEIEL